MIPMLALAVFGQLMQGYAKGAADDRQLGDINRARRLAGATRDANRKGVLSLLPAQSGAGRGAAADAQAMQLGSDEAAARQSGLAQFAGGQGALDGISAGQQAQVADAASRRVGSSADFLNGLQGRVLAENQRGRNRRGILAQNQLNDDALNRSLGPLDAQLYADQAKYAGIYQMGGLAGAVGAGMDSRSIWSSAAARAAANQQGGGSLSDDGSGLTDSRGSQAYVDPNTGEVVQPA